MKPIILYYSESGNTKKVADAIGRVFGFSPKKIENVKPEDLKDFDLIFIGTPIHGFAPAKKVLEFLDSLPDLQGKKGAAFCIMHGGGDKRAFNIIKEKFGKRGVVFLGGFSCLGHSRLFANFGPRIFNRGKPSEGDLKRAEDFGREVMRRVSD